MNIDWNQYINKIVALDKEGFSSREISILLSKTNEQITEHHDRSVRSALQRYRQENNITPQVTPSKILVFDIETSPMITYAWNNMQSYIPESQIIADWFVICWSAKWLFDDEIISCSVTSQEAVKRDDKRVTQELWKLFNEANIVIAHYGDKFDIKMMNGRFLKYGLNLPSPYQSIDTKKYAGKRMRLPSLSLNYIARYLGLDQKHSTNFSLWVDCMDGKQEALDEMQLYCDQDIRVLEDVYLHLRPFIQPHPNLGLFIEADSQMCPSCASTNLKREGTYETTVNSYDAYRCKDCGSLTRSRKTNLTREDSATITSSLPR